MRLKFNIGETVLKIEKKNIKYWKIAFFLNSKEIERDFPRNRILIPKSPSEHK